MTTPTANIVTKAPPPKGLGYLKPREKSALRIQVEAMTKGQCLELRGAVLKGGYSSIISNASKATGKKYTMRNLKEGADIYCLG